MKIIQIVIAPSDESWSGELLGLGDDGVVYAVGQAGRWVPAITAEEDRSHHEEAPT